MGKNVLVIVFFIHALLFQYQISKCEDKHLIGNVVDCDGGPLFLSTIEVKRIEDGKILIHALTDQKGNFDLVFSNEKLKLVELVIGHTGYREKHIPMNLDTVMDIPLMICMTKEYQNLNEVVIKSKNPIVEKNDTVVFNAEHFRKIETRNLESLLKNIPGFSISNGGVISFNGQIVDKILMDGEDLAGSKYQMLSKNLGAALVEKIKVIPGYHEDPIIAKVKQSDKVAIDIGLFADVKNNINKNIGFGMANFKKYYYELNAVQARTNFKWLTNFSSNSIAKDEENAYELSEDEKGKSFIVESREKDYLSGASNGKSSLPGEYLNDNRDKGTGFLIAGNFNHKFNYSGQAKWYRHRSLTYSEEKYSYDLKNVIQWAGFRKDEIQVIKEEIGAAFKVRYQKSNKDNLICNLVIKKNGLKEKVSTSLIGDMIDQYSDTTLTGKLNVYFHADYSRLINSKKIFNGSISISNFGPSENLLSDSKLYVNRFHDVGSAGPWNQFIRRNIKAIISDFGVYRKFKNSSSTYGLQYETVIGFIGTNLSGLGFRSRITGMNMLDVNAHPYFKYEMKTGKDSYLFETYAGVSEKKGDSFNYFDITYSASLQFVKKIGKHHSLKWKLLMDRQLPNSFYFHPDSLLTGSGIMINGAKDIFPLNNYYISIGINGMDLFKQRSWNVVAYAGNKRGEYKNSTKQYDGLIIWDLFESNTINLGSSANGDFFIPELKIKTSGSLSITKSISAFVANDKRGFTKMYHRRYAIGMASGFKFPLNVEMKEVYEISTVNWNENVLGKVVQMETYFGLKINPMQQLFLSALYFQKYFRDSGTFHGLDIYAVLSLNSKLSFSLKGHNLLDHRFFESINSDILGVSITDTKLVGRYLLFAIDWVL